MPLVSVLLPVRDAAPWLESSLASLARQRLRDFEVIAVDDGSRDGSGELLERVAAGRLDPGGGALRLRVVHTPPLGLPAALNTALGLARAPYVARHDADDLSHRDRLRLQHAHLAAHRRVTVVGCRLRMFPSRMVGVGMRRWQAWHNSLLTHEAMVRDLLIDSPLAHGSALMRRRTVEAAGGWSERGWAEDLDLWVRLVERGARLAKLPQMLYAWRQHPGSATRRDPRYARERFVALKLEALRRGLLRHGGRPTLVGVGTSLGLWVQALTDAGLAPAVVPRGRPLARHAADLVPPLVLVFGASATRERWRRALCRSAMQEGRHFTFVA